MRVTVAALVGLLPFVLGGCPQLQSDFSIATVAGDGGPEDSGAGSDGGGLSDGAHGGEALAADAGDASSNCTPSPPTLCSGTYVDTMSSAGNCGACGSACATNVANAAPACACGTCSFQCSNGYSRCAGECVNEQVDNANCGACGTKCTGATSCSGGRCVAPSAVAVSFIDACAVLPGGSARCWGNNQDEQLGYATTTTCTFAGSPYPCSTTPLAVPGLTGAIAIAPGDTHTCALVSGGSVKCWGLNQNGQLGIGTSSVPQTCNLGGGTALACSTTPATVSGLTGATAIVASADFTCVIISGGTVECWGINSSGQLGTGNSGGPGTCYASSSCSTTPIAVPGLNGVTALALGNSFACAVVSGGSVKCWGDNSAGQLGTGTLTGPASCNGNPCSASPIAVSSLSGVAAVATGASHACALLTNGTVECWGSNTDGQVGSTPSDAGTCVQGSTRTACPAIPTLLPNISGAIAIAAGEYHTCVLLSAGTVECWGDNSYGQLGNGTSCYPTGTNPCPNTPVAVSGLTNVAAIAAGGSNTCALLSTGTVECWGDNTYGQLGNGSSAGPATCDAGTAGPCSTTPVTVSGL